MIKGTMCVRSAAFALAASAMLASRGVAQAPVSAGTTPGSRASQPAPTPSAAAPTSPFRIAIARGTPAPCTAPASGGAAVPGAADPGAEALAAHLSKRLKRPVELCRFATRAEAGKALAAKAVDFALLDRASLPQGDAWRPLLTERAPDTIGRVLSVVVVPASSKLAGLGDLHGKRFVYGGTGLAYQTGPKAALSDNGLPADAVASEHVAAAPEQALGQLRSGAADVMVLHAAAWQRLCRPARQGDAPCANLKAIWTGREHPRTAWTVRTDLDRETLYRLVGVLVALHLENRQAFDWMAPGATELTPVEADAFGLRAARP